MMALIKSMKEVREGPRKHRIKSFLERANSSAKALRQMYPAEKKCKEPSVAGAERTWGE